MDYYYYYYWYQVEKGKEGGGGGERAKERKGRKRLGRIMQGTGGGGPDEASRLRYLYSSSFHFCLDVIRYH